MLKALAVLGDLGEKGVRIQGALPINIPLLPVNQRRR